MIAPTTGERWTIEATAASTQLSSESFCRPSSVMYCGGMMGAITNSCGLLPVSCLGAHFPLGCIACSSLWHRDFHMKRKVCMSSQRHSTTAVGLCALGT